MSTTPLAPLDRRVKVPHLVLGLLFLGLTGLWALGESDLISGQRLAVLGPALLVLAGVVGLVGSLANARRRPLPDPYAEPEPTDDVEHTATYDTDTTEEIR